MKYDEALKVWGAKRLADVGWPDVDPQSVSVSMDFNEGYACCGGSDPNCYCSFAKSPSAEVVITGTSAQGNSWGQTRARTTIDHYDFDFASILKEIVAAAGGIDGE